MRMVVFLAAAAGIFPLGHARLHETEAEIESRYGKPVCWTAYDEVDPDSKPAAFPENFRKDGTPWNLPKDDGLYLASSRLIFFNTETERWEDLRSSVLGRQPAEADSVALKKMTANAKRHLCQRFYILNGIGISVVYLGGRSVSESYHQKLRHFAPDFVDSLVQKSFPGTVLEDEERSSSYPRFVKIVAADSRELRGCATYLDGVLTVSATPYFGFLKAMEVGLQKNAEILQNNKLEGF